MTNATDGWITHDGGPCPVAGEMLVDVVWKDDSTESYYEAIGAYSRADCVADWPGVLRYRIVQQGHVLSHPKAMSGPVSGPNGEDLCASCDQEWNLAHVCHPKAQERVNMAWQALGYLSTLHPHMEIDCDDPLGMARQIEAHVQAELASLRAQVEMGGRVYEAHCDLIAKYERLEVELERLRKGVKDEAHALILARGGGVSASDFADSDRAESGRNTVGHLLLASPTYEQTRLGRGAAAMEG